MLPKLACPDLGEIVEQNLSLEVVETLPVVRSVVTHERILGEIEAVQHSDSSRLEEWCDHRIKPGERKKF